MYVSRLGRNMAKCLVCKKNFENNFKLIEHEKRRCKNKECEDCGSVFHQVRDLERHKRSKKKIVCTCCQKTFCNSEHHQQHLRTAFKDNNKIVDLKQQIHPASEYESYDDFQKLVEEKDYDIGTKTTKSKFKDIYNLKIDSNYTYENLQELLLEIYKSQQNPFKINLAFGFILYQIVTDEFKYYYVSSNNFLFDHAITISSLEDLNNFMKKVINLDLATNYYLKKPSSSWVLAGLTNVQICIYKILS